MRFQSEFVGVMPIIIHADNVEEGDKLSLAREELRKDKKSVAGDDRSPPWTWQSYLYVDEDAGHLVYPSENIMKCIMKASASFKMSRMTTFKSDSQSAIFPGSENFEFLGPKGVVPLAKIAAMRNKPFAEQSEAVQQLGFRLFVKRATVGQSKHIRVRARFDKWTIRGVFDLEESIIEEKTFRAILDHAGNRVGLGDWRPSAPKSPGPFGRFEVKLKKL